VQQGSVELDLRTGRTTAEEIYRPAFADELCGEFPRFWIADGFDNNIRATRIRVGFQRSEDGGVIAQKNAFVCAEHDSPINLLDAASNHDNASPVRVFRKANEHKADRAEPHYCERVARLQMSLIQPAQHASERFG